MSIYRELKAAGCELDNHESDLYVKSSSKALAILRKYDEQVKTFKNNIDGSLWIELPFQFEPYWERKQK